MIPLPRPVLSSFTSASGGLRPGAVAVFAVSASLLAPLTACADSSSGSAADGQDVAAATLSAEILAEHPFDDTAFTQGLEVMPEGDLLVSTGLRGDSRIFRAPVDDITSPTASDDLDVRYFGEGTTLHGDTVWQLTWQAGTAFARDPGTLQVVEEFSYDGEGWGLCSDGAQLVMSDGTPELTFRDAETFEPTGTVDVTLDGEPVEEVNELECTQSADTGEQVVWANVWHTDRILRIDPATGDVTGVLEVDLPAGDRDGADVLNGIAEVPGEPDTFYLTGKLWDTLYKVRIDEE